MPTLMSRALENLTKRFLRVGTRAEEALRDAVKALETRNTELAEEVIEKDSEIDQLEVDVEEECLKILALFQPVASDLRYVVAILKMNNDIERIGDLAVNIAERVVYLSSQPPVKINFDFHSMAVQTQKMLADSMDAVVNMNAKLAKQVCVDDDIVDDMNRQVYQMVEESIEKDPGSAEVLFHILSVARHLERVADLASNICEDVIYTVEGKIVRHKTELYGKVVDFPEAKK